MERAICSVDALSDDEHLPAEPATAEPLLGRQKQTVAGTAPYTHAYWSRCVGQSKLIHYEL